MFKEGFVERTQARIANRHRCLGDVGPPGAQKVGGFFQPFQPQKPRDACPGLLRKNAGKVEGAAPHFLGEHVERGRVLQVTLNQKTHALDAGSERISR